MARLRAAREEAGLSLPELGRKLHLDHSTIGNWETGVRRPDAGDLRRWAAFLRLDADKIIAAWDDWLLEQDHEAILERAGLSADQETAQRVGFKNALALRRQRRGE